VRGALRTFRDISAGLLVLALALDPLAGRLLWLSCQKALLRHDVAKHIVSLAREDGLVLFEFTKFEAGILLRWEHPREFEYQGRMYDIVEAQDLGDAVRYLCWWDRQETRLNAEMRSLALRALGQTPRIGEKSLQSADGSRLFCRPSRPDGPAVSSAPTSCPSGRPSGLYVHFPLNPPTPPPERG
jgi:hypothetical protein